MARVLFLGAPVEPPDEGDVAANLAATGHNTGNLLIGLSLRRQLNAEVWASGTKNDPAFVNENYDYIAIAAANFVYERFDFTAYADYLERTKLPVLMVGLGAQSSDMSSSDIAVPAGTRRFLEVAADRCSTIGVRGAYTASVLQRIGIRNVRVTGCPSLYYTRQPELRVIDMPWRDDFAISVNGSQNVIGHSFEPARARAVEHALLANAVERGYDYVYQNEAAEIQVALDPAATFEKLKYDLQGTLKRADVQVPLEAYFEFVRAHGRAFFNFEDWRDYIRKKDFSVGTRFHGNLIALISGVPAVIFAHDTRTLEMCELMHIPHVPIVHSTRVDYRAMYEAADFRAFERHYTLLYRRYVEFLNENGADHLMGTVPAVPTGGRLDSYIINDPARASTTPKAAQRA